MALQPRTAVVCLATPTHDKIHTFAQLQASGCVTAACVAWRVPPCSRVQSV